MKITEKHRIKYKLKEAPGEPVEMAIYRDVDGHYLTATGDSVAHRDGEPIWWVEKMLDGSSNLHEGEIISPPLEPKLGMVVWNPKDSREYYVCYRTGETWSFKWVDQAGNPELTARVQNLVDRAGWEVVS